MSSDDSQEGDSGRIESAIVAVSPLLDLVLSVGERISRVAEPVDYEYYPVREEEEEQSYSS